VAVTAPEKNVVIAASPAAGREARRSRSLIVVGAVLAALGVALAGSESPNLGGVALLAGWLALGVGIHRFGRLGAAGGD
jgi:hypothetical protein